MADLHQEFLDFNKNITLSQDKCDNLKRGRDSLRSKIKSWFTDHDKKKPTFCWQGSFAMKTTVNPLGDAEYDLDDGIYLSGYESTKIEDWPATSTVHTWIKSAVEGHTKKTTDKNTCIRVVYSAGYHIDYPIYIMKGEQAYLAHKTEGWIVSDPKAFRDWFVGKVKSEGEQLRRLVKYLKAWKDYGNISLKGIEITILMAENFDEYEGRDDKSMYYSVSNVIDALENSFSCTKPVEPYEDLFSDYSDVERESILNVFKTLKSKLELSIDEKDPQKATEYLIEILGDRFPKGKSLDTKEDANGYVQTPAPGVLRHDGRSA